MKPMKKKLAKAPAKKASKPAAAKVAVKESRPVRPAAEPITETDWYRQKLEELRDQLNVTIRKKKEEAIPEAEVGDEGDVAMRSLSRDLVFEVTDNEHHLLDEVEAALRRIEKNTYGVCEANGERIAVARLKAIPYARYCINCQGRFERS
jgi:DnaK suppressor protein